MKCLAKKNKYFRQLVLFAFNQGAKAANAADLYSG